MPCSADYAWGVRLLLLMFGALLVVVLVGMLISALKWLLIVGAVLVGIGLLAGWRPGRTTTNH
jgi:hypothetical protein